jgi:hypothetical protein
MCECASSVSKAVYEVLVGLSAEHAATARDTILHENIDGEVLATLTDNDIIQLFPTLSFGCRRKLALYVKQRSNASRIEVMPPDQQRTPQPKPQEQSMDIDPPQHIEPVILPVPSDEHNTIESEQNSLDIDPSQQDQSSIEPPIVPPDEQKTLPKIEDDSMDIDPPQLEPLHQTSPASLGTSLLPPLEPLVFDSTEDVPQMNDIAEPAEVNNGAIGMR